MNTKVSIEDASTPEEFIAALRRHADDCFAQQAELQSSWQDRAAGKFWAHAARALNRAAASLEKVSP